MPMDCRAFFWTRDLVVHSDLDRVAPIGFDCRLITLFSIYRNFKSNILTPGY